jgi:hypothetical protein
MTDSTAMDKIYSSSHKIILFWSYSFPTKPHATTGEDNIGVTTASSNVQRRKQVMHRTSAIILNNNGNSGYTIILSGCAL